jgi:glycosyltransferase involved in cell wall biosynthesis
MFPTEGRPSDGIFVKETVDILRAQGVDVDVFFIRGRRTPVKYGVGVLRLWLQVCRKKYDLVHAYYGYSGFVACMQPIYPVVLTLCGSDVNLRSQRPVSRIAARLSARTIVQTSRMKHLLGKEDATVMHLGVNLDIVKPSDRRRAREVLGLSQEDLFALFPYDPLRREKRFGLFEKTIHEARASEPRLKPLIVTQAPKDRMPLYMSAADVLVMTSETEGSPNTIKEALACGLPIVSVDVGDVREVVEGVDGCWICDAEEQALAGAVMKAVHFGRTRGRARAEQLSSRMVGQKLVTLYEEVLQGTQRPS